MLLAPPSAPDDIRRTLAPHRVGNDPTTLLGAGEFWRATLTVDGPGTVWVRWTTAGVEARAWGPGGEWLLARVPDLLGATDQQVRFGAEAHPAVLRAQRAVPGLRLSNGHCLYHTLLPTIIGQRVTGQQARRSWRRLCLALGEQAPGPPGLRLHLPPRPEVLARQPYWWFHPLGIERKRAEALRQVAAAADRVFALDDGPPARAHEVLGRIPGIGPWTIGASLGHALGDPDAVAVGDYHLKNFVAWTLAGEARGSDARMLELLAPYQGQRGRVIALLGAAGWGPPRFGAGLRILPMERW